MTASVQNICFLFWFILFAVREVGILRENGSHQQVLAASSYLLSVDNEFMRDILCISHLYDAVWGLTLDICVVLGTMPLSLDCGPLQTVRCL